MHQLSTNYNVKLKKSSAITDGWYSLQRSPFKVIWGHWLW